MKKLLLMSVLFSFCSPVPAPAQPAPGWTWGPQPQTTITPYPIRLQAPGSASIVAGMLIHTEITTGRGPWDCRSTTLGQTASCVAPTGDQMSAVNCAIHPLPVGDPWRSKAYACDWVQYYVGLSPRTIGRAVYYPPLNKGEAGWVIMPFKLSGRDNTTTCFTDALGYQIACYTTNN